MNDNDLKAKQDYQRTSSDVSFSLMHDMLV